MKTLFIVCLMFFWIFLTGRVAVVESQSPPQIQEVRPFTDLTLELSTPSSNILPLQPIPVVIRQRNQTMRPIRGYDSIGFSTVPIFLYYKRIDSPEWRQIWPLTTISALYGLAETELAPGSARTAKEWIALNLDKCLLEPGTYYLQARLANSDRTQFVDSNVIRIEISQPVGVDLTVFNLIRNSRFQKYLFSDAEFVQKTNVLEMIANTYSQSGFANDALFVLGERYFRRRQYPLALGNLTRLENNDNFIFADKVRSYLAEIRRVQNSPEAKSQ